MLEEDDDNDDDDDDDKDDVGTTGARGGSFESEFEFEFKEPFLRLLWLPKDERLLPLLPRLEMMILLLAFGFCLIIHTIHTYIHTIHTYIHT